MLITTYSIEPHLHIRFVPEPITKVKKIVKPPKEDKHKREQNKNTTIDTYV